MIDYGSETRRINAIVNAGARTRMNDIRFLEKEIQKWKQSPIRRDMILADRYYQGDHDILHTPRTAINEKGELEPVKNLPDNRIVDNQYQKAVDQKKNYLLSKPITVTTQNDQYTSALKDIMDKRFLRTFKRVAICTPTTMSRASCNLNGSTTMKSSPSGRMRSTQNWIVLAGCTRWMDMKGKRKRPLSSLSCIPAMAWIAISWTAGT